MIFYICGTEILLFIHPKETQTPNETSDDLQAILYDLLHLIRDGHFQNDTSYIQSSLAVKTDRTTTTKKRQKTSSRANNTNKSKILS